MPVRYLSNSFFFEDIRAQISNGKPVHIKAKGNSMLPFIKNEKDIIILNPVDGIVKKGMLVLARTANDSYVIHRVIRTDQERIILKGDGNIITEEVCTKEDIIAKVAAVIHNKRMIKENGFIWNLYRYAWPGNDFARRVLLAIYRRADGIFRR